MSCTVRHTVNKYTCSLERFCFPILNQLKQQNDIRGEWHCIKTVDTAGSLNILLSCLYKLPFVAHLAHSLSIVWPISVSLCLWQKQEVNVEWLWQELNGTLWCVRGLPFKNAVGYFPDGYVKRSLIKTKTSNIFKMRFHLRAPGSFIYIASRYFGTS